MLMPGKIHIRSRKILIKEAMNLGQREFISWYKLLYNYFTSTTGDEYVGHVPSKFISGTNDVMFVEEMKALAHNQELVSMVLVENAGHLANIDAASVVNKEIFDFIKLTSKRDKSKYKLALHDTVVNEEEKEA